MEPQAEVEPTWIELAGQKEEIDLFLVCDTTGSMGTYLPALKASLRQVFLAAKLLYHGRLMVHIVSYKDYCDGDKLLSSVSRRVGRNDAIVKFADDLQPTGGGDAPEAVKTAFNYVVMTVDEIRTTKPNSRALVFLYTDAPPHHKLTGSNNIQKEINAINDNPKYTVGHDWIGIQKCLQERDIPVFTFHSPTRDLLSPSLYALLGPTVILPNISTTTITKASMGLLLQLMNQQFDAKNEFTISKFTYNGQDYGPQCYLQDESMIPKASELTCTREPFVFAPIDYMYEDLDGLLPLFVITACCVGGWFLKPLLY